MLPLSPDRAYILYDPAAEARVHAPRWQQQAARHLGAALVVYGTADPAQEATLDLSVRVSPLAGGDGFGVVRVQSLPLIDAPALLRHGEACAAAMGGAGMDALVARARRVWCVDAALLEGSLAVAPALVAATLSLDLLGPVAPPGAAVLMGIKGLRAHLEAHGWH